MKANQMYALHIVYFSKQFTLSSEVTPLESLSYLLMHFLVRETSV